MSEYDTQRHDTDQDRYDHGAHWAGIVDTESPPEDLHVQHAQPWETTTSPSNVIPAPEQWPPLGQPGRHYQTEAPPGDRIHPIEVRVVHALDTHDMVPSRFNSGSYTVSATQPIRLVGINRRRAALLINPSVAIVIGDANLSAANGLALSANVPFSVSTTDEVWVIAQGAAGRVDFAQTWHDVL